MSPGAATAPGMTWGSAYPRTQVKDVNQPLAVLTELQSRPQPGNNFVGELGSAPRCTSPVWRRFLASRASGILACGFLHAGVDLLLTVCRVRYAEQWVRSVGDGPTGTKSSMLTHRPHQGYFVSRMGAQELDQIRSLLEFAETELIRTVRWPAGDELEQLARSTARSAAP